MREPKPDVAPEGVIKRFFKELLAEKENRKYVKDLNELKGSYQLDAFIESLNKLDELTGAEQNEILSVAKTKYVSIATRSVVNIFLEAKFDLRKAQDKKRAMIAWTVRLPVRLKDAAGKFFSISDDTFLSREKYFETIRKEYDIAMAHEEYLKGPLVTSIIKGLRQARSETKDGSNGLNTVNVEDALNIALAKIRKTFPELTDADIETIMLFARENIDTLDN